MPCMIIDLLRAMSTPDLPSGMNPLDTLLRELLQLFCLCASGVQGEHRVVAGYASHGVGSRAARRDR